jgi:hypothetical protein
MEGGARLEAKKERQRAVCARAAAADGLRGQHGRALSAACTHCLSEVHRGSASSDHACSKGNQAAEHLLGKCFVCAARASTCIHKYNHRKSAGPVSLKERPFLTPSMSASAGGVLHRDVLKWIQCASSAAQS